MGRAAPRRCLLAPQMEAWPCPPTAAPRRGILHGDGGDGGRSADCAIGSAGGGTVCDGAGADTTGGGGDGTLHESSSGDHTEAPTQHNGRYITPSGTRGLPLCFGRMTKSGRKGRARSRGWPSFPSILHQGLR